MLSRRIPPRAQRAAGGSLLTRFAGGSAAALLVAAQLVTTAPLPASAGFVPRVVHDDVVFHPPYRPPLWTWNAPDAQGRRPISLSVADGTTLRGWFYPATRPHAPFVLVFYGAAQTIAASTLRTRWLCDEGFNVVLYDYRGYGYSDGTPHLRAVVSDALREYDETAKLSKAEGDGGAPLVYGWSLGAIVAARVGAERPVRALALEAPIASAEEELSYMSGTLLPPIVRSTFRLQVDHDLAELGDVVGTIRNVRAPLLVLHGTDIDPTPIAQAREVYDASPSHRKTFAAIPVPLLDNNAYGDTDAGRALAAFLHAAAIDGEQPRLSAR